MRQTIHTFLAILIVFLAAPSLKMSAQISDSQCFESYLQYVPMASAIGLGLVGVSSENNTLDRAIVLAGGFVIQSSVIQVLKHTIHETRPDGRDDKSFPSGHTATAFIGAEIVRHEYGWGWGLGAYGVAALCGYGRYLHQRHYPWDVAAGACFGILGANVGYWVLNKVNDVRVNLAPSYDPMSGASGVALAIRF